MRELQANWKLSFAFYFNEGGIKTVELVRLIQDVVNAVTACGLDILTIVCDQAANNVAAVNYLKKDTKAIYTRQNRAYDSSILIGNTKIFSIFDVPHLLKGVRNNLLNADLAFKVNGGWTSVPLLLVGLNLRPEHGDSEKRHPNKPEMALSTQAGDSSGNPPLRKKKPSERRTHKAAREAAMAQPGTKTTREARTAKPGISQKQHKAVREASKAKPGTSQKQEKATREAPEPYPATSHSKATGVKRNLSDGSTPKAAVKHSKTNIETGRSYSGALTDIRMAIVPENYPESPI
ncbi:hypothetical protein Trydic_g14090 [Trypoxylus dichotomus]